MAKHGYRYRSTSTCSLLVAIMAFAVGALGFAASSPLQHRAAATAAPASTVALRMGLFDGLAQAFTNQEFKRDDQRVRASHILVAGEDDDRVLAAVVDLLGEIDDRARDAPDGLRRIFAEVARRESRCPSAADGGDLGLFGPGTMAREFDAALFPPEGEEPPPPGAVLGPVVTEFGCHIILVTQREENRDQVEEKLARND